MLSWLQILNYYLRSFLAALLILFFTFTLWAVITIPIETWTLTGVVFTAFGGGALILSSAIPWTFPLLLITVAVNFALPKQIGSKRFSRILIAVHTITFILILSIILRQSGWIFTMAIPIYYLPSTYYLLKEIKRASAASTQTNEK